MLIFFSVETTGSSDDLFTVFDYKRLLSAVEGHVKTELNSTRATAYYNPESNKGCVIIYTNQDCSYLQELDFPNGSNILTVKFQTN
jgi:hypothetical protein